MIGLFQCFLGWRRHQRCRSHIAGRSLLQEAFFWRSRMAQICRMEVVAIGIIQSMFVRSPADLWFHLVPVSWRQVLFREHSGLAKFMYYVYEHRKCVVFSNNTLLSSRGSMQMWRSPPFFSTITIWLWLWPTVLAHPLTWWPETGQSVEFIFQLWPQSKGNMYTTGLTSLSTSYQVLQTRNVPNFPLKTSEYLSSTLKTKSLSKFLHVLPAYPQWRKLWMVPHL